MPGKLITMAKVTSAARAALDSRASVEERRDQGTHGYVLVVPRELVVALPLSVEEAMRLLVSGGVVVPRMKGEAKAAVVVTEPAAACAGDKVPGGRSQ